MRRQRLWKWAAAGLVAGGVTYFSWSALWYWAVDWLEGSVPLETIGFEG